jgi:hypothetical protein
MPFFPTTPAERWSTYGTIAAVLLLWLVWRPGFYPVQLNSFNNKSDYHLKLVEWERDRVISLAKGVAGTSVTYFLALVPIIIKQDFIKHTPPFVVIGIVAGFLGTLILACDMSFATSRFTRSPVKIPRIRPPRSLSYNSAPPRWPSAKRKSRSKNGDGPGDPPRWPGN